MPKNPARFCVPQPDFHRGNIQNVEPLLRGAAYRLEAGIKGDSGCGRWI